MTWMFIKGGIAKDDRHYPDWAPLRQNMGYARHYAEIMDLGAMRPWADLSTTRYCLANEGKEYLIYFPQGGTATLNLRGPRVPYEVEWFIPQLSRTIKGGELLQGGDFQVITAPYASGDAVLYLKRK